MAKRKTFSRELELQAVRLMESADRKFVDFACEPDVTRDRLKVELAPAFAAPDVSYRPLTAAEVITRNRA